MATNPMEAKIRKKLQRRGYTGMQIEMEIREYRAQTLTQYC